MRDLAWKAAVVAALAAAVTGGCRGRGASEADAQYRPAAAAPAPAAGAARLAAGTPAGGLREWTAEVLRGLAGVPALATRDVGAAQKEALDLYLSRQEYIEMYWGTAGKLTRGATLGTAVKEAETRFHLILAQLQPGHAPDTGALKTSIASLGEQYGRVMQAAERADAPLDPHAVLAPEPARAAGER